MIGFFRHGSNAVLVLALLALAVLFAMRTFAFSWIGAIVGAIVFLTSEYSTHRFLFHARPSTVRWVLKLQHRLHYDHHIDPPKLDLLFLPIWFVLPVSIAYYGVYFAITRNASVSLSLVFGSMFALTFYEWAHYVAHVPINPVTPVGRYMKKYHLWHHFKNEHLWFGVTNPAMDHVMGSYQNRDTAPRSTTVREIWKGMEP